MSIKRMNRRQFLTSSGGAVLTTPFWATATRPAIPLPAVTTSVENDLDTYSVAYMRAMNAPGMALGLADSSKVLRATGYGFADVDKGIAVNEQMMRITVTSSVNGPDTSHCSTSDKNNQ